MSRARVILNIIGGLILIISLVPLFFSGGGIENTDTYIGSSLDKMDNVFIKYKICTDKKRDCRQKEVDFYNVSGSNLQLIAYLVPNMKVANEIMQVAKDEFEIAQKNGDKDLGINLTIFKKSKKEINKIGFFDNSFNNHYLAKLVLKGEAK